MPLPVPTPADAHRREMPGEETTALVPRPVGGPVDLKLLLAFEQRRKSLGLAFLLLWTLGLFGGHRFYLKKPLAPVMLGIRLMSILLIVAFVGILGLAGMYLWVLLDGFQLAEWVRKDNRSLLEELAAG